MGAILGQVNLDWCTPVAPQTFAARCNQLAHRAKQGRKGFVNQAVALAWFDAGVPQDAKLQGQPWLDRELFVLFDGWLSNQVALCKAFDLPIDARLHAIIVAGWRRLGEKLFAKLEGGFALAIIDRSARTLVLARDVLGMRQLVYRKTADSFSFASEEAALLSLGDTLSKQAIAGYFANSSSAECTSFFTGIQTLAAGGVLVYRHQNVSLSLNAPPKTCLPSGLSDADAVSQFKALMQQALYRRGLFAGNGAPAPEAQIESAVSLSGGLDSNLIVSMAKHPHLRAASWSFSDFPISDELAFAQLNPKARGLKHQLMRLPVADILPLSSPELRVVSLNTPVSNVYRELKTRFYQNLSAAGVRQLAHGNFGDHGILDAGEWLSDMFARRDFSAIFTEYRWRVQHGPHGYHLWRDTGLRRLARRMLGLAISRPSRAPLLTEFARKLLAPLQHQQDQGIRARQLALNYGARAAFESCGEAEFSERFGLSTFSPFRDPDLAAFMCALPAKFMQRGGVHKWIYREALRGTSIPEAVRVRPKRTSLQPILDAAIAGECRAKFAALLFHPDALWPQFVDRTGLQKLFDAPHRTDSESALIWKCTSLELWITALRGQNVGFALADA
jgi:asparagine synthetase B (glutamine-hydrolysing)